MELALIYTFLLIIAIGVVYWLYLVFQFTRAAEAYYKQRDVMRQKMLEIATELAKATDEAQKIDHIATEYQSNAKIVGSFRGRNIYDHVMTESGFRYDYDGIAIYDEFGNPVFNDSNYTYLIVEPGLLYKKILED